MRLLPDRTLYYDVEKCLRYARSLPPARSAKLRERERFHFYWYGAFTLKQAFAVKSFLATQDLEQSELWLWLDAANGYAGHEDNPLLRPLLPHIQVRKYDPPVAARGTPVEGREDLYHPQGLALRADCFRFVTLYRYGGTYLDIDVQLLRDFRQLYEAFPAELTYRWSSWQRYANSAVLRLRAQSPTSLAILERAARKGSCHPKHALNFRGRDQLDLLVLPCPIFDPLWPIVDHAVRQRTLIGRLKSLWNPAAPSGAAPPIAWFEEFFTSFSDARPRRSEIQSYRDFFPGAFAYHWHNQWGGPEVENSYFGMFNRELDIELRESLGIQPVRASTADCLAAA